MNQTKNRVKDDIVDSNDNDLYDDYVTSLADARSDELISNGQIEHARSIIRNLFSHAEKDIRIFTSCLHPDIYRDPKVVEAATAFLAKDNARLSILIQDVDKLDKNMPFFELCSENSEQCKIQKVVHDSDKSIKQHMVVMDAIGYRFCTDMGKNEAIASFSAPSIATNLAKQFDILFARAKAYLFEPAAVV